MECLDSNSRPRAVVLLSSEPRAASEKVKLWKLMVKRRRERITNDQTSNFSSDEPVELN